MRGKKSPEIRYAELIHELDHSEPVLSRTILALSVKRIGVENRISKDQLITELRIMGAIPLDLNQDDAGRLIRSAIGKLRKRGYLLMTSSKHGGLYMAASRKEVSEFVEVELRSKILDMIETLRAIEKSANEVFGDGIQESLFEGFNQ